MTLTPMEKENLERYQTKNPFLLVFAKKAKGDCDKILRLLKNKVPVRVDEIDDTVRYFKSRGFENWLVFGDEKHTELFKERASAMPPIVLFHKGDLELLEGKEKETYGRGVYFLSAMGMTSLHRYAQAKKQEAEKENELE